MESESVLHAASGLLNEKARWENALYRKVAWRLIPFLMLCYVLAYLVIRPWMGRPSRCTIRPHYPKWRFNKKLATLCCPASLQAGVHRPWRTRWVHAPSPVFYDPENPSEGK